VRKGIQRNIEVACVGERAQGYGIADGDIVVSLYSALDLLPLSVSLYSRTSMTKKMTDDERQGLIDILSELAETTKIPLVASRLVDKFSFDIFSKLWPVFAGHKETYVAAFKALSTWHLWRLLHATPAQLSGLTKELVAYRESMPYGIEALSISIPDTAAVSAGSSETSSETETSQTWTCDSCCIVNPVARTSCRVCQAQMPTWTCGGCVQVNPVYFAVCKHCHVPLAGPATPAAIRSDTPTCAAGIGSGAGPKPPVHKPPVHPVQARILKSTKVLSTYYIVESSKYSLHTIVESVVSTLYILHTLHTLHTT
jgi:hypothetical protein